MSTKIVALTDRRYENVGHAPSVIVNGAFADEENGGKNIETNALAREAYINTAIKHLLGEAAEQEGPLSPRAKFGNVFSGLSKASSDAAHSWVKEGEVKIAWAADE